MYVPHILKVIAAKIRLINPNDVEKRVDRDKWKNLTDVVGDWLEKCVYERITLAQLIEGELDDIDPAKPRQLAPRLLRSFALAMFWSDPAKLMSPRNLHRVLSLPEFPEVLFKTVELCHMGLYSTALTTLHAVGKGSVSAQAASFYLYLICRGMAAEIKQLPFNGEVARMLRQFDWPDDCMNVLTQIHSRDIVSLKIYGEENVYDTYLILMHNWARALVC